MSSKSAFGKYSKYLTVKNVLIAILIVLVFVVGVTGLSYLKDNGTLGPKDDVNKDEILQKLKANFNTFDQTGFNALSEKSNVVYINFLLENGGHFVKGIPIMKVGNETFTTDDFNLYFFNNNQQGYFTYFQPSDVQILSAIDEIYKESVLLQSFAKNDNEVSEVILDDTIRDADIYITRESVYTNSVDEFLVLHTPHIKGERITIWHRNLFMPPMGPDEAFDITRAKIIDLHTKLVAEEINMEEAGNIISNDDELAVIDYSYKENAYSIFSSKNGEVVFNDEKINEVLYTLEEGEYSDVLTGYVTDKDGKVIPGYFMVILVSEKTGDGMTIESFFETNKSNYKIIAL